MRRSIALTILALPLAAQAPPPPAPYLLSNIPKTATQKVVLVGSCILLQAGICGASMGTDPELLMFSLGGNTYDGNGDVFTLFRPVSQQNLGYSPTGTIQERTPKGRFLKIADAPDVVSCTQTGPLSFTTTSARAIGLSFNLHTNLLEVLTVNQTTWYNVQPLGTPACVNGSVQGVSNVTANSTATYALIHLANLADSDDDSGN